MHSSTQNLAQRTNGIFTAGLAVLPAAVAQAFEMCAVGILGFHLFVWIGVAT